MIEHETEDLWAKASEVAYRFVKERGFVTTTDLVDELLIDRGTAWKYIKQLAAQGGWDLVAVKSGGRGKGQIDEGATRETA